MGVIQNIKDILTAPLTEKLDMVHLFLIVGLVLVSATAWIIIMGYITRAATEVIE